jgi:hypothetical protein
MFSRLPTRLPPPNLTRLFSLPHTRHTPTTPTTPSLYPTQSAKSSPLPHPLTVSKRFTALWAARKKASDAAAGGFEEGTDIVEHIARAQRFSSWSPDALVRLMGERRSQKGAKHQSQKANRHQWLWTYYTNVLRKQFHSNMKYRPGSPNWSEWWSYDPRAGFLQHDQLGPDAVYKYKPTPHHLRFRHYNIHPRPIESNLITGNEKVADKILPADYMDKIFNQPEAGRDIRDRFRLADDKIHYDINEYIKMGFKQRIVAKLFHLGMPHQHEALNVPNLYRRRYVGSNEVWVYGSWVDKREINDFFLILSIYTVGLPSAVIIKAKMDSEKLNGHLIHEAVYPVKMPLEQRTRLIQDSDRTTKPQFELVTPPPRNPLLD